jgi:endoglucanase Acf2
MGLRQTVGKLRIFMVAILLASLALGACYTPVAQAAIIGEGAGSYTDTQPAGTLGPQAAIYKTANVTGKMPTNEWWSSLAFKKYPNNHSELMYPQPLSVLAKAGGLGLSYPPLQLAGNQNTWYQGLYAEDLMVGVSGLNSPAGDVRVDGFSDWTVSVDWSNGAFKATIGRGMPFVYLTKGGGDALITFNGVPNIISNSGGAVHATINGRTYGIFAPSGSNWTQSGTLLQSNLGGKNYYSVAILPDNSAATFNSYRAHAFAFVTGTNTTWSYDATSGNVTTNFSVTTSVKEGTENRPLLALYRHQWLNIGAVNTSYTYGSARGEMRVVRGGSFSTTMKFNGVLPWLPDKGDYDRTRLYNYVNDIYSLSPAQRLRQGPGGESDTYWTGKALNRLAQLIPIAEQVGHTAARNAFLQDIKNELQNWFTAGAGESGKLFYYNSNWGTLIGYPSSYGADADLNDHHFHHSYFIFAAALVAMYDPAWAGDAQWGSMVKLLIKDAANWSTSADGRFPRLRNWDTYAGHAYASGNAPFGHGNNQESSSESINFSTSLILWGSATGNTTIRDLGIYMYTTEVVAIEQYWFDVDNAVFPANYSYDVLGILWDAGGEYGVWWGPRSIEEIHGINFLPITGGSLYLGRRPDYVTRNYNELISNNNGSLDTANAARPSPLPAGTAEDTWQDIIWSFQAFADPQAAVNKFGSGNYEPEWGETKAHTYHWLHNLKVMGQLDTGITGNSPLSAVFNKNGTRTYVAYNPTASAQTVTFSNGVTLNVNARAMATSSGGNPPCTTPPTVPGNLSGTASGTSANLSWNASTVGCSGSTISGYRIYRNGSQIATTSGTGTSYSNTGLANGTYSYTVAAVDNAGRVSGQSNTTSVTIGTTGGGRNAYARIEAESYNSQSGTSTETTSDAGGGQNVGWIANGDYLVFNNVDFGSGGAVRVDARVASGAGAGISGLVEFWIDGLTTGAGGTKLGDFALGNTGGWQTWQTVPASVGSVSGTHTVYVKFTSGQPADFVNINWFQFFRP